MSILKINNCDTVNTLDGVALSIWMAGCPHKCKGCHNEDIMEAKGNTLSADGLMDLIDLIKREGYKTVSILGGEPLSDDNVNETLDILSTIKVFLPETQTMVWTGFKVEELSNIYLDDIDILIDGKYVEELKVEGKLFGSSNQRMLLNLFNGNWAEMGKDS